MTKLTKSKVSVVSKRFDTKLKQALEKVKIPGPISGVSKHWNNGLYRGKLKRTETGRKLTKSKRFSCFETFRNKTETSSEKRWKYPAPFLVFRNTETIDYIGKNWNGLKQEENWLTPKVSVVSKRSETKLKQALKKVKIPGPISGVSKHWNNGLYREKIETDWNMTKID